MTILRLDLDEDSPGRILYGKTPQKVQSTVHIMTSTASGPPRTERHEENPPLVKRLNLRLAEEEKNDIDAAAALLGSSTSAFVRSAVLAAAQETLRAHATLRLTREGGRRFVEAIKYPPQANARLRSLARELGNAQPGR